MDDKLARLERLARLKETGALSPVEFEAEKRRLLEAPEAMPPAGASWMLPGAVGVVLCAAVAVAAYFALRPASGGADATERPSTQPVAVSAPAAQPASPSPAAAAPPRPDRPQRGDVLDNPTQGAPYFGGWIYNGSGLFNQDLSAHVQFFAKGRQLLLALTDPVRRNARGGIIASRVRETLVLTLGPGEEYMPSCYLDGRHVVMSIHDRTDTNVRAIFTDGRRFIIGAWLPAGRYDGCEVHVD